MSFTVLFTLEITEVKQNDSLLVCFNFKQRINTRSNIKIMKKMLAVVMLCSFLLLAVQNGVRAEEQAPPSPIYSAIMQGVSGAMNWGLACGASNFIFGFLIMAAGIVVTFLGFILSFILVGLPGLIGGLFMLCLGPVMMSVGSIVGGAAGAIFGFIMEFLHTLEITPWAIFDYIRSTLS